MSDALNFDLESKMQKVIDHMVSEFVGVRTGRAHPGLVSDIEVDYYGALTPLKQLSTITVPEGRTLLITPFDKTSIKAIEKAILAANIGVTPQNDGGVIRINLPTLTGERRKELSKLVRKYGEEAKIVIRNLRRDCNDFYKKKEANSEISEDQYHDFLDETQKVTDDFSKKTDNLLKEKEKEILEEF